MLTMYAKMAAATGDLQWETRYDQVGPRLSPDIQKIMNESEDHTAKTVAVLAVMAHGKLVKIENDAFDLVREGKNQAAASLLLGTIWV